MTRTKDLFSVLILSAKPEGCEAVAACLDKELFETPNFRHSGEQTRRELLNRHYDLVVIDPPIPNTSSHELALDVAERQGSAVVLLADMSVYDQIRYRVERAGIMTVEKPYSPQTMSSAVNLAMAAHRRILAMEEENRKLRFKVDELRLVNRAKWALHENLGMDEPSAHRYIEKTAMNNRITRHAVAQKILKEYE